MAIISFDAIVIDMWPLPYVIFYSGWITKNCILDYESHRTEMKKKYKLPGMLKAVKEIDEYIKTAQVSHSIAAFSYFSSAYFA